MLIWQLLWKKYMCMHNQTCIHIVMEDQIYTHRLPVRLIHFKTNLEPYLNTVACCYNLSCDSASDHYSYIPRISSRTSGISGAKKMG